MMGVSSADYRSLNLSSMPFKQYGVSGSNKCRQAFNQFLALLWGNESRRLHRVDEQLDLRGFKVPGCHMVEVLHSAFFDYIHAELHKLLDILSERSRVGAVMPYCAKWADMSPRDTGWAASSVVSQKCLNGMSVRLVRAMFFFVFIIHFYGWPKEIWEGIVFVIASISSQRFVLHNTFTHTIIVSHAVNWGVMVVQLFWKPSL